MSRHEDRFAKNPRMAQMVSTYRRMTDARKTEIADDSARFLGSLSA